MTWKPGQSGNPDGTKRPKLFDQALRLAITATDGQAVRDCAETLLAKAKAGEPWAVQMLADRLDGKAMQPIEASGDFALTVNVLRYSPEKSGE